MDDLPVAAVRTSIYTAISIVAACAEFPLLLWFIIFGVNNERWQSRAKMADADGRLRLGG